MTPLVSPAALLLWAALLFLDDSGCVSALIPAVTVHELGHVAAIIRCGGKIHALCFQITGPKIEFSGLLSKWQSVFCHLAGPIAGGIYSAVCLEAGGSFLRMTGLMSLGLTAFNLLPILPLDGGKALQEINEKAATWCSVALSLLLFLFGFYLFLSYGLILPMFSALWLWQFNLFSGVQPAFRLRRRLRWSGRCI